MESCYKFNTFLVFRCVLCRAKILRLQQNHSNRVPRVARVVAGLDKPRSSPTTSSSSSTLPQSVSYFSVQVIFNQINNQTIRIKGLQNCMRKRSTKTFPFLHDCNFFPPLQDSMAASASNYSFASGVSSVSSATSASSSTASSVKSFNFDSLSSFQGGNLISTSQLNRTVVRGSLPQRYRIL